MTISPTFTSGSPSAPRWWSRADMTFVIPGWSEGPGPESRDTKSRAHRAAFRLRNHMFIDRVGNGGARRLKIRGDAFVLPVTVARGFRSLRTLELFCRWLNVGLGGFSARFGFGERALGRRRERLAWFGRCGRGRTWSIVCHF